MNRRRIRRQLHRGYRHTFWGRRGFITIRFPVSVIPPKPDMSIFDVYGKRSDVAMTWCRETNTGTHFLTASGCVSSGRRPCDVWGPRTCRHVFGLRYEYKRFHWREVTCGFVPKGKCVLPFKRLYFRVPKNHLQRMEEYLDWNDTVRGWFEAETTNPLVDILTSYSAAKTHYVGVSERFFDFTYSVKPQHVRWFSYDIHGVLNELDRMVKNGQIPWYRVLRHA